MVVCTDVCSFVSILCVYFPLPFSGSDCLPNSRRKKKRKRKKERCMRAGISIAIINIAFPRFCPSTTCYVVLRAPHLTLACILVTVTVISVIAVISVIVTFDSQQQQQQDHVLCGE